jgi:hypothetical protein
MVPRRPSRDRKRGARALVVHSFERVGIGHFFIAGSSVPATGYYHNSGDSWTVDLSSGISSQNSYAIANAPDAGTGGTTITIPNSSEFTALFDQYRIKKVKVEMYASNNTSGTGGIVASLSTIYVSTNDYADTTVPPNLATLLQREDLRVFRTNDPFSFSFVPKPISSVMDAAGTFAGSAQIAGPVWLSCADTNVEHTGFKFWIDTGASTQVSDILTVVVRFELEFRAVQ